MRSKYALLLIFLLLQLSDLSAQEISLKDTLATYNQQRISINKTGAEILGTWGIASIASGTIGYLTAKQDEWKYFHEMNIAWGIVNTGVAAFGLAQVRKEMAQRYNADECYQRYKASKKVYLINAGLDILYIGDGLALSRYSETAKNNTALYSGFGKSITVQGVFLLIFDNVLFASLQQYHSNWFILMNEISVTNTGFELNHRINKRRHTPIPYQVK